MKVKTRPEIHDHVFDEYDHQGLSPNRVYPVIGIECEYYRILGDDNSPILYPKCLFTMVDASVPDSWIRWEPSAEECFVRPPEMSERGFWERYFDGDPEAIAKFRAYLARVDELGE